MGKGGEEEMREERAQPKNERKLKYINYKMNK